MLALQQNLRTPIHLIKRWLWDLVIRNYVMLCIITNQLVV